MKFKIIYIITLVIIMAGEGCIKPYNPDITDDKTLMVVEGLITDQATVQTVKLSLSQPVGTKVVPIPVTGANVTVSDDDSNIYGFSEAAPGTYQSSFQGVIGRKYSIRIKTNTDVTKFYSYESYPIEMTAVPPIDSIYYEKVLIGRDQWGNKFEGAQIYLDTHDNGENCKYYRWSFTETWEFRLPFDVPNWKCWRTENSYIINVKSTANLAENSINKYPLYFIDNTTDRLSYKYSVLVGQYSLSQDEFDFWEKIKNITQNNGGLYDMIPASVTGNIHCIEEPGQAVLGYFSVSAESTKRIFIKDYFSGMPNLTLTCYGDTIYGSGPIPGLGIYIFQIASHTMPTYTVVTPDRSCADCTTRGTTVMPAFWEGDK
jgi:hypothetical protein